MLVLAVLPFSLCYKTKENLIASAERKFHLVRATNQFGELTATENAAVLFPIEFLVDEIMVVTINQYVNSSTSVSSDNCYQSQLIIPWNELIKSFHESMDFQLQLMER